MATTMKVNGITVNAATGKPMGRPPKPGSPLRSAYDQIQAQFHLKQMGTTVGSGPDFVSDDYDNPELSDEQILTIAEQRFDYMKRFTSMACEGGCRALVISGKGGVGKTFTIESITGQYVDDGAITVEYISGMISPISLYSVLWNNRLPGQIVVMDDADAVFFNEDSVALLKAAMDSKKKRRISWGTLTPFLKDNGIPTKFDYEGSLIFLSNIDFQRQIDSKPNNKITPHLEALMTRPIYLDLKLHTPREVGLWIEYMIDSHDILVHESGLSKSQQEEVLDFITENRERMRSLSIRSALKLATYVQMDMVTGKNEWKTIAKELELRY